MKNIPCRHTLEIIARVQEVSRGISRAFDGARTENIWKTSKDGEKNSACVRHVQTLAPAVIDPSDAVSGCGCGCFPRHGDLL